MCLSITDNKLEEKAHVKLNGEVSCIDITPLDDSERSQIAAVGTWDMQVLLFLSSYWPIISASKALNHAGCAETHPMRVSKRIVTLRWLGMLLSWLSMEVPATLTSASLLTGRQRDPLVSVPSF